MIPLRIIQTGPARLPLFLQAASVNVRLLHPGFEYMFFGDAEADDLVATHFPEYREAYHSFRFRIQKYDLFRYLAIYHYGGFYLDLDIFLAHDVSRYIRHKCVFPFEELTPIRYFRDQYGIDWQIANYAFGAEPGDAFVGAIIENCLRAKADPSWVSPMMKGIPKPIAENYYVTNSSGPGLVSRTLADNPQLAKNVTVLVPPDVGEPELWHQFGSVGVHKMASSWRSRQSYLVRRVQRFWDTWTFHRVLADGRKRGKTRSFGGPTDY